MANSVEKTGKTIDEARQAALQELGVSEDRVQFEILEEPSKGFLGFIGGREARIRVTVMELSPLEKAVDFLQSIFRKMELDVQLEKDQTEDHILLNLVGEHLGILIGKHGQTLDALQYLVNLAANRGIDENRTHIVLDVEHYRQRREETLQQLAHRLAEKVKRSGRRIMLEPMNRHERKVIHLALQDNHAVTTYSAGDEPYRKVIIDCRRGEQRRDAGRRSEEA